MKKLVKRKVLVPSTIEAYACSCGTSCACNVSCSCVLGFLSNSNQMGIVNVHESNYLSDQKAKNYRK